MFTFVYIIRLCKIFLTICMYMRIYLSIYIYIHSEEEIVQLWELLVNLYVCSSQFLLATIQFHRP